MNIFILIVATTFFAHSSHDPTVLTFQEFNSIERCEQMAKWVKDTYGKKDPSGSSSVTAQCVKKD
jgi:hypothetical protein